MFIDTPHNPTHRGARNISLNITLEEHAARLSDLSGKEAEYVPRALLHLSRLTAHLRLKSLNAGYLERLTQIGALEATLTSKDQTITEYKTR